MAGPGGGSRGGGSGRSRGGFSGGGNRGGFSGGHRGGFSGGHNPGGFQGGHSRGGFTPRHYGGGFHPPVPPRPMYTGGGYPRTGNNGCCCSGFIITMLLLLIVGGLMFQSCAPMDGASGYSEEVYQDYTDRQYREAFGGSSAYEDNLLISVLVSEDDYSYYYIAWVGDHVVTDINHMLGGSGTVLGQAMTSCINENSYKYSLDSNLAQVMEILTAEVRSLGLHDCFSCTENHTQTASRLINDSDLDLTASTVNNALAAFTDETGIPVVIVVEDMNDVFGGGSDAPMGIVLVLAAAAMVLIVVALIAIMKAWRGRDDAGRDYSETYE